MSIPATVQIAVDFCRSGRPRTPPTIKQHRVPRAARQLALAHEIERRIRTGELDDLAAAARAFGLTRARVTQLASLTLLAPAIQAEILAMPLVAKGRDPITERTLRPIVAETVWERQMAAWRALRGRCDDERGGLPRKRTREEDFAATLLSELDDAQ